MLKNRIVVLLILTLVFSTVIVGGCSSKETLDAPLVSDNSKTTELNGGTLKDNESEKETKSQGSKALKERAEEEGVSVSEMEQMIEELTKMTAETYGFTAEEYKASLLEDGKTPFDEFTIAADYMGITIKEYYEYEKQKPELSEEDKEVLKGMGDAIKELKDVDLSAIEEQAKQLEKNAQAMENAGDKETSGDVLELAKYEVFEVVKEENDESAGYYGIEYTSKKEVADIVSYFKDFLEETANYFIMDSSPAAANISGTVNGNGFDVVLERDSDKGITYIAVIYHGKIEKSR